MQRACLYGIKESVTIFKLLVTLSSLENIFMMQTDIHVTKIIKKHIFCIFKVTNISISPLVKMLN